MSETIEPTPAEQIQPPLAEAPPDVETLALMVDDAEANLQDGLDNPGLINRLAAAAGNVREEAISSGGFTIPGTDEWIPGTSTTSYKYIFTDPEGKQSESYLDTGLA